MSDFYTYKCKVCKMLDITAMDDEMHPNLCTDCRLAEACRDYQSEEKYVPKMN